MSPRIAALLVMLGAALTLVTGAGAGSQPPKINLKDPTAVNNYLQSIGVDPSTVVRQVGLNNYAGPNCPGIGWNCTTSTKVVQISSAGGQNKFKCTGEEPENPATDRDTNTCVVMQGGPDNQAQCQMKDTGEPTEAQHCTINQDGDRNLAIVDQLIEQRKGPDQDATQTANLEQTATDKNQAQVHQDVKQSTKVDVSAPDAQDQNVHQVAIVDQSASGSENFSHVHQNQDLSESGAAGFQNQNVGPLPAGITDCDLAHKPGSNPNACAHVIQSITDPAGGKNESHVHQNIHEHQTTTATPSTQTQENVSGLNGIEAHVEQSNPPDVGTNRKISHQDGRQRAEGGTTQVQTIDPNCCGVGTTFGGAANLDDVHATAMQSATLGSDAEQRLGILSDTNHLSTPPEPLAWSTADDASSDVCRFHHNASNNEASTNFTITFDPCTGPHSVSTECFSSEVVEGEGFCTPPPSECTNECVFFASSPTFGQPIAPPDFGEPSDFPGPIFPGI